MLQIISIENQKILEVYVCIIYHIVVICALIASFLFLFYCIKNFKKSTEHATSKILVAYYTFTSLVRAIIALYFTILVLYFKENSTSFHTLTLRRIIIALIIKQRFIPFLMMADWRRRSCPKNKFGESGKSLLFFGINLIIENFIFCLIIMVSNIPKLNVPLYFNICIFITITFATIMTKLLYGKAKNLRKRSVLTSSLIERHTFSKMVVFFKRFFPIIIIDTFCGTICVSVSLTCLYIINLNPSVSFCLSFMWLEVSTIINSFYATKNAFLNSLKRMTMNASGKKGQRKTAKVSPKGAIIQTMTGKIPSGQTIDEYFTAFNSWIK